HRRHPPRPSPRRLFPAMVSRRKNARPTGSAITARIQYAHQSPPLHRAHRPPSRPLRRLLESPATHANDLATPLNGNCPFTEIIREKMNKGRLGDTACAQDGSDHLEALFAIVERKVDVTVLQTSGATQADPG